MALDFKALKELSQNLSLLYVEDDKGLRDTTAVTLKNLFLKVDVAYDGIDGIEKYKNHYDSTSKNYDIILSDIQMPRLDGIGLSKKILRINKEQKIIIVSAYNDKEYLIELINIGVEGFLQKPLSPESMLEVLYNVCSTFSQENIISLNDNYTYNITIGALFLNTIKVKLSINELKLLDLLIQNKNQSFNAVEIFNHLYFNEPTKDFSNDSIKSIVKRLRKKLPKNLITNTHQLGYSLNL